MITPSDICLIGLLGTIIEFGRNKITVDINEVLLLLTFLSDNLLHLGSCKGWENLEQYFQQLATYISDSSPIYLTLKKKLQQFESIDSLIDMMESTQDYLNIPSSVDPNSIFCPYSFKRDSLVGVYIRTTMAKWDLLEFGDISRIYENLSSFAGNSTRNITRTRTTATATAKAKGNQSLEIFPIQAMKRQEPRAYLSNAEIATSNSDLLPAVESIHAYYDSSGTNPLRSKNDLVAQTRAAIDNYASGTPEQKNRYQKAMLTLANMWIRNGYYFYGSSATEEGMKMAHQLGDHASVTYALLLLHHIIHEQENTITQSENHGSPSVSDPATTATTTTTTTTEFSEQSTENILIRCIQKSYELKLKALEIQAIQLLARYRMKGPLKESVTPSLGYCPTMTRFNQTTSSPHSCELTPYMLWALLQATLTDKPSSLFAKSSQSKQKNSQNNNSGNNNNNNNTSQDTNPSTPLSPQSKMELYCQSYLLSSEFWSRLYLPSMSLLMCYRAFRHCGVTTSTNSFLQILLKYCSLIHELCDDGSICLLYTLGLDSNNDTNTSSKQSTSESDLQHYFHFSETQRSQLDFILQKLNLSLTILNNISKMEQLTSQLNPEIKLKMEYLKYLIQIKQNIVKYFLLQVKSEPQVETTTGPGEAGTVTAETGTETETGTGTETETETGLNYLKSSLQYSNLLIENLLNHSKSFNSKEYLLSQIYYCYVLSFLDYQMALQRIEQLLATFQKLETTHWKVELMLMKIIILYKEIHHRRPTSIELLVQLNLEYYECVDQTKEVYLPVVSTTLSSMNLFVVDK